MNLESTMDGRWRTACSALEESPDSADPAQAGQKVGARRKPGRSDPTEANGTHVVLISYKRTIETSLPGNGQGGTR